jgi:hypothetical protein
VAVETNLRNEYAFSGHCQSFSLVIVVIVIMVVVLVVAVVTVAVVAMLAPIIAPRQRVE